MEFSQGRNLFVKKKNLQNSEFMNSTENLLLRSLKEIFERFRNPSSVIWTKFRLIPVDFDLRQFSLGERNLYRRPLILNKNWSEKLFLAIPLSRPIPF